MTTKDDALNLVKTNTFLNTSQTVYAQWNHHLYQQPATYGYYTGTGTAENCYVADSNTYSVVAVSTGFTAIKSITGLSTLNTENAIRITFDAAVTGFPSSYDDIYTKYLIRVIPYAGGVAQSGYSDIESVVLQESVFNKYEIIFNTRENITAFDRIDIAVQSVGQTSTGATVAFKNICVSRVSYDEIIEDQASRLSEIFNPHRPGDQLLENDLISTTASPYNIVSQYYITMNAFSDTFKNDINLLPTALSPFNEFKYFIGPRGGQTTNMNIFSIYNTSIKTNEIYIKTQNMAMDNIYEGKLATISLYIKSGGTWSSEIVISRAKSLLDGCLILRYDGANWTTNDITYPQINSSTGSLSNSSYVNVQGIRVKMTLAVNTLTNESNQLRARVIEISPRLKLDLSNFIVSTNTTCNIDEGNYPIPVGLASSNEGSITLENLPRYVSGTSGPTFQIFDNNSNSPLNGLIMPETKFTIYTNISDTETSSSSALLKTATMYSENWNSSDIETVEIQLSDYGKYLQSRNAPDMLLTTRHTPAQTGGLKNIVEAILQASGFSDYDRASLKTVSDRISLRANSKIPIFFSKHEQTIWSVLSELLLSWQVSFYFDKNGILKFKDLLRESKAITYSTSASGVSGYFQLTDTASNSFIPNIETLSVEMKPPIDTVTTTYRTLSYPANIPIGAVANNAIKKYITPYEAVSTIAWNPNEKKALDCAELEQDIDIYDTQIKVGKSKWMNASSAQPLVRMMSNFSGYGIIDDEIIYWGSMQYQFTPSIQGFSDYEDISSQEDLEYQVALRIGGNNVYQVTQVSVNNSLGVVTLTTNNSLAVGDIVYVSIPNFAEKFVRVTERTATTIKYNDTTTATSTRSLTGIVSKSIMHLSYTPTGWITNVQRGLFGTKAVGHRCGREFSSGSIFKGNSVSMTLGDRIDTSNDGRLILRSLTPYPGYLGFYQQDSERYNHYQFAFIPRSDLDSFGFFLGADSTVSGGKVTLAGYSESSFKNGIYVELYSPQRSRAGTPTENGIVTFGKPSGATGALAYVVENNPLVMAQVTGATTPGQRSGAAGIANIKFDPLKYVIDVWIDNTTKLMSVYVNNHPTIFKPVQGVGRYGTHTRKIRLNGLNRTNKSFGIFSRNFERNTFLFINSIEVAAPGQPFGGDYDFSNKLEPQDDLDALLSNAYVPRGITRPFSLASRSLLRGISIYEIKFNNDIPYYDLSVSMPHGAVGSVEYFEDEYQRSVLQATPFRGKIAMRNKSNRLLHTSGANDTFNSMRIDGRKIDISSDKQYKTKVSYGQGLQNIEISAPWCNNVGLAERINADIVKNIYAMNTTYQTTVFGNPGIEPGDYVLLTYSLKNISKYTVVSSVSHEFSSGGLTTTLKLRSLNISA